MDPPDYLQVLASARGLDGDPAAEVQVVVVPLMIRRAVRPVELRGRLIPEGADVFIAPVMSHRLPRIFEDPENYRPDRYLTHPELAGCLHGFGGGAHRCLGEHFADLLAHVALTKLFQQFDLTLTDPHPAPVRTPAFKGPRSPCRIRYRRKL